MARRFINVEEAAQMLGVSPETLNEMRERQKVHGYRDGGSWKFKQEDIERLIADREAAEQEGEFAEVDEDPDSILLSEVELGQSDESTSSTIIGGKTSRANPAESDIQLAASKSDSVVDLDAPLVSGAQGGSDVLEGGSGVSPLFDDLDTLDLEMPSAADSGISSVNALQDDLTAKAADKSAGGSEISLTSDILNLEGSGLSLGGDEEFSLGEAPAEDDELLEASSGGSAIDLTAAEDDDLVLGGSSHGDLSRTGDSGISLLNPADSGLSLESAPLDLGGSAVESLELGEDDMLLADEPVTTTKPAAKSASISDLAASSALGLGSGIGAASGIGGASGIGDQAQGDDDFLLTPLEDAGVEESDSGSQVIALESDVEFEEAGAGASGIGLGGGLGAGLEDDLGAGLGAAGALGAAALTPAASPAASMAPGAAAGAPAVEAPFSGWNVASLVLCALFLMFSGMFMFDLMRSMWSWQGAYSVNSSLMDMVLSMF